MKKIVVIGSSGAGKSTFAKKLALVLDIPLYHLDQMNWRSGWQEVSKEEQKQMQLEVLKKDAWIIDGNYGGTLEVRLKEADTVVFLDFHRVICISRALRRVLRYRNQVRPDMAEGCPERFDLEFMKYIWNFPETKTPHILKRLQELPLEKRVFHFRKPHELDKFLLELEKRKSSN
ncbi:hypothetical protein CQS04_12305 [Chryseomicrobium excrementi]|uniref:Topology modulation protein n=1 Tax=Chryseomicrobium excrementi TaxID=2041346 RepID=A0A2M9EXS1_9BACL|nr:DNA topology modulation protein [Chryseomicrobium excrementi]PJK16009.1 hypothetical protein CQS04_12305 [Chryseomicrobium excrementi]